MEEVRLVEGLRERREEAVEAFLERYRPLLFHCIGHFESEPVARDDMYQELVLYALERLDADRFDAQKGSLGTWLYRVAWCRCVDLRRKQAGQRTTQISSLGDQVPDRPDPQPGPGEQVGEAEIGDLVRRALVCLEGEERSLLDLRYMQGQTLGEISDRLGISSEQAKYRLKRASAAMRKVLLNEFSLKKMAADAGYLDGQLGDEFEKTRAS